MRSSEEGTFVGLVATVLRHPRLLFLVPAAAALLSGAALRVRGPEYIARADIRPQARDNRLAGFSGLAQQFGLSLDNLGASDGPEYYAVVLRSNEILGEVVASTYHFSNRGLGETEGDSIHGTLMDIWEVEGESHEVRRAASIRRLRSSTNARPNLAAGLVRLEVSSRWPELAVQINRRFLAVLDSFNIRSRQVQAAAQRAFVEERLAEVRAELMGAEDELVEFESRNRMGQAPELQIERQRLQRRVDITQQVYLTLAQGFEQARIDEVRDTPVITLVDAPESTVERSGGLVLFVAVGTMVGLLLGLALIFFMEEWARQSADHPEQRAAFTSAKAAAWGRLWPSLLRRDPPTGH